MSFKTEQETFWAGDFGNAYVDRNNRPESLANRIEIFSKIISKTKGVNSILELGANVGQNLKALNIIKPYCSFGAVEINQKAISHLKNVPNVQVFEGSIIDFSPGDLGVYDFTFTSGVLIHINPDELKKVYSLLYNCSSKYILIKEYYSPKPVEIDYRGHDERLYKRDFAGEMLDLYADLELVDYGFQYHRDNNFPMDDCNWFILRKGK